MKGFIEVTITKNYPKKTLLRIDDIVAIYEHKEKVMIGKEEVIAETLIEGNIKLPDTIFRCLDTYEEIKKKIEEA